MGDVFRPSTAFPAVYDYDSALGTLVTDAIAKGIEKLAGETWSKFNGVRATPEEEQAFFRKVYEAKEAQLYQTHKGG